ncbi:DUF4265 domain-containing protein [Chitinophaga caseinilytica]|uniref:DUF4265 domain-containing protein n=1 Tax=Chitinophaga caseinilytica TaxID=2267521 RepID=UPI003C2D39CC
MPQENDHVKILFHVNCDNPEDLVVETLWAIIIEKETGLYQIDNIPFYIPLISCGDIVFAEYDEAEERLVYRQTVKESGNSTIQIELLHDNDRELEIREIFREMGCESEGTAGGYFVLEVPFDMDYTAIKQKLEALRNDQIIDYAESCLSNLHKY